MSNGLAGCSVHGSSHGWGLAPSPFCPVSGRNLLLVLASCSHGSAFIAFQILSLSLFDFCHVNNVLRFVGLILNFIEHYLNFI